MLANYLDIPHKRKYNNTIVITKGAKIPKISFYYYNSTKPENCQERTDKMSVGKNVRKYREESGLDQTELASKAGITQMMISHIETGRKIPSVAVLADIAKALNCTMDDLVAD